MSTRKVIRILVDNGWYYARSGKGSHRIYLNENFPAARAEVPYHSSGRDVSPKVLHDLEKVTGLSLRGQSTKKKALLSQILQWIIAYSTLFTPLTDY